MREDRGVLEHASINKQYMVVFHRQLKLLNHGWWWGEGREAEAMQKVGSDGHLRRSDLCPSLCDYR